VSEKYERVALQWPSEIDDFIKIVRQENIKSFLEIGSKHGGSFWRIARSLAVGSRVVSVDLPHGDHSFKESLPHLQACVKRLRELGYDSHLFVGDSTDSKIIESVAALGPYDLCFIDANHTAPYVRRDWESYGLPSRIVAFHDIGWVPEGRVVKPNKLPIDVPDFWNELKTQYRHVEIKHCPRDNGIGVLWR